MYLLWGWLSEDDGLGLRHGLVQFFDGRPSGLSGRRIGLSARGHDAAKTPTKLADSVENAVNHIGLQIQCPNPFRSAGRAK